MRHLIVKMLDTRGYPMPEGELLNGSGFGAGGTYCKTS